MRIWNLGDGQLHEAEGEQLGRETHHQRPHLRMALRTSFSNAEQLEADTLAS